MRELKPILNGDVTDALTLVPTQTTDSPATAGEAATEGTPTSDDCFALPLSDELKGFLAEHFGFTTSDAPAPEDSGALTDQPNSANEQDSSPTEERREAESKDSSSELHSSPAGAQAKPAFEEPRVVLSPREIQDRIRGGQTVEELIEYSGMQPRKIESFAYPVMAERARIAELGKRSRPRRQDGPTKLSLWEILATAFAARGLDLADSEWDAYRDPTGQWIVTVTWNAGHTVNVAEWSYQAEGMSALTVARNSLAAELIDPDFSHRNRDLAPQQAETELEKAPAHESHTAPSAQASMPPAWQLNRTASTPPTDDDTEDDDFLQHPEADSHPKRKKKTVMPSWEDVLLGVRPNGPKK